MHNLRTVLFDLDGTLIDSVRLILDSYHHTLATHGLPPRTDEEWLEGVGTPLIAQFGALRETAGMVDALIATYREYNLKHHDSMVTVYPGVVDVVRELKQVGIGTGLVTSKNRSGAVRGLVYVGDSIHDMRSGRAAGVRTAAVLWGPFGRSHLEEAQPDYWLERPSDVLDLVGARKPSP